MKTKPIIIPYHCILRKHFQFSLSIHLTYACMNKIPDKTKWFVSKCTCCHDKFHVVARQQAVLQFFVNSLRFVYILLYILSRKLTECSNCLGKERNIGGQKTTWRDWSELFYDWDVTIWNGEWWKWHCRENLFVEFVLALIGFIFEIALYENGFKLWWIVSSLD